MRTIVTIYSDSQPADGIMSTLSALDAKNENFRVVDWNPNVKPAFDMFAELNPDLIISDATNTPNLSGALKEYSCKTVVCGSMPPASLEPDLLLLPESIPEMIIKHCTLPYLQVKNAANYAKFRGGKRDRKKQADILYFASHKEAQSQEADILSILSGLPYSFRVVGHKRPLLQYVGATTLQETADFMASSKIVIDIGGFQLHDIAMQKGFYLSNVENGLYPCLHSLDPEKIEERVEDLLSQDKKRDSIAKKAYKETVSKDTYFHRLSEAFILLGWDDEAKEVTKTLKELTE